MSVKGVDAPSEVDGQAAAAPIRVIFVCTHNSARSVLSEGMLNHLARKLEKDVRAYSASIADQPEIDEGPWAERAARGLGVELAVTFPDVVVERNGVARARIQLFRGPIVQEDAGRLAGLEKCIIGGYDRVRDLARTHANGVGQISVNGFGL